MIEDGKIYDFENDWQPCNHGDDKKYVSVNKSLSSFFRIVDFQNEKYYFSDVDRIKRIRDINKILSKTDNEEVNRVRFLALVNKIVDEIYPIEIPYLPQTLTAFIEVFPGFSSDEDCLGVLYFRDETNGIEDAEMIECKRYFRLHSAGLPAEEIREDIYNDVKQKWMNKLRKEEEKVE